MIDGITVVNIGFADLPHLRRPTSSPNVYLIKSDVLSIVRKCTLDAETRQPYIDGLDKIYSISHRLLINEETLGYLGDISHTLPASSDHNLFCNKQKSSTYY